ncbi:N-acetylmuramoyl-L-alanine amidase [Nitratifractor sp.]|uniref:N-acetylmuramoyl-L-alanine amidase n=1 Tax=Nitratifractor sp. TaxID=2268144 RepID=UPI0025FB654E|nr:N-acetylmuramoyl-L-alanine amidase [Nitratifractor sp.]
MVSRETSLFRNLLLGAVLIAAALWPAAASVTLRSLEMGHDRLLLHFDRTFDRKNVHDFVLKGKGSFRYVFDLKKTHLSSKDAAKKLKYGSQIRSIRIAQYRRDTVRLVIETPEPYAITHYPLKSDTYLIVLPKGSSGGPRSVRSLFASIDTAKGGSRTGTPPSKPGVSQEKKTTHRKGTSRKKSSQSRLMKQRPPSPHRRYRIIVDPGHGGKDTGAMDPTRHYREKDAVLQIALRLRKHLRKMGFNVVMTRSSDHFIKLHRRTRFANLRHGDIFVSVHANAVGRLSRASVAHGVETYFLSPARSARARRVAAAENSVGFTRYYRNSMNSFINTLTRSKIILSNKLALDVQRSILANLRSRYRGVADGGVRPAPFWVLVGAEMPAILVETGYITHPVEKKRLFDPRYQDLEAKGIAEGIARYLINRERELE